MRPLALVVAVVGVALGGAGEGLPREQVLSKMASYEGPSEEGVDTTTLHGKVMCGYQGWFTTEGDGSGRGWFHYGGHGGFEPGRCSIELWPDMSELDEDEKYPTPFRHADGSVAHVFSSMNRKTVLRHFEWMQDYGIDGAFVQRFTGEVAGTPGLNHSTTVLGHCREGANRFGRTYAVMYDTDFGPDAIAIMKADWQNLVDRMHITSDPAYLHHKGKPVISLWGFGFTHREWDPKAARAFIEFLKNDPTYGGLTVMLGVPAWWRILDRDCRDDKSIHEIMCLADIISPWNVGRFGTPAEAAHHAEIRMKGDIAWCAEHGLDYMPVVFPGFSWHNMFPDKPLDQIPRLKGQFLWTQYLEARKAGATMVYQAMFDEVDEGTAIFKCTNDPPVGESEFLTCGGLPSDHYLWLVGTAARMMRGELDASETLPERRP